MQRSSNTSTHWTLASGKEDGESSRVLITFLCVEYPSYNKTNLYMLNMQFLNSTTSIEAQDTTSRISFQYILPSYRRKCISKIRERVSSCVDQITRENSKISISCDVTLSIQPWQDSFQERNLLCLGTITLKLGDPDRQFHNIVGICDVRFEPVNITASLVVVNGREVKMATRTISHELLFLVSLLWLLIRENDIKHTYWVHCAELYWPPEDEPMLFQRTPGIPILTLPAKGSMYCL